MVAISLAVIAANNYPLYPYLVAGAFGQRNYSFGTEAKIFSEPHDWPPTEARRNQKNGIPKVAKAERKGIVGNPDLGSLTTSHVERVFLSFRQELTRFTRRTLGYSKDLRMHKLAIGLHIGLYNLVRKHTSLDGYGITSREPCCSSWTSSPWASSVAPSASFTSWPPFSPVSA